MLNNGYFQKIRPQEPKPKAEPPCEQSFTPDFISSESPISTLADVPIPETVESTLYIPGLLNTKIGKYLRVEFLIGNSLTDRTGRLTQVGASYIILESQSGDHIVCDLFSIKFVTIVESPRIVV